MPQSRTRRLTITYAVCFQGFSGLCRWWSAIVTLCVHSKHT
jgi:hypothetical protein